MKNDNFSLASLTVFSGMVIVGLFVILAIVWPIIEKILALLSVLK